MEASFWLVVEAVKKYGRLHLGAVTTRKTKPATRSNEVAVRVHLEIPDTLFERPTLEARVVVPESDVPGPVVTAEVADNIAEALSEQLGLRVHISSGDEE